VLRERGVTVPGFDLLLSSDIPVGSGLSSSAALLVALFRALREAVGFDLTDVEAAQLSQRVENEFVGAHVGIMDQMASSLAGSDAALFLDTRSLEYRRIPLPTDRVELAVVNSGVTHSHAHGGYNERRAECEAAAAALGVAALRDVDGTSALEGLPEPLRRRALHVVTENARVLRAAEGVDAAAFGALMNDSHASLRDDYEVSVPALDRLVALLQADPDVHGARLTGAGFGGACVALCSEGAEASVARRVLAAYSKEGHAGQQLVPAQEGP
jgi:galactokinase